jgi:tol-pal system protein YbgF
MNAWRFRAGFGALLACLVMIEGGCWGRNFFRMPGATQATSTKVDSLLKENALLKERIARIELTLKDDQEFARGNNAQLKMDLEELKDQLNALQESLREAEERSSPRPAERRRSARPDTVGVSTHGQSAGTGSASSPPRPEAARADSLQSVAERTAEGSRTGGGGEPDTAGAGAASAPPPEELYRQIYLDYSRREYQVALDESESFLNEYPDDPLVEETLFLRGQCLMELGNHNDALKEFSTLLQRFPRGKRAPGALLRMAISYEALGQKELAAGVARRLIKEHPHSEEATAAEERFSAILQE